MAFKDILKPGKERIRAITDIATGELRLRSNETAEVDSGVASLLVRQRRAKYATRLELLNHIGPFGEGSVEPGIGSILEVSVHQALAMERDGTGRPAPPISTGPRFPADAGPMVRFTVTPPKKVESIFLGPLGRSCVKGEVHELPEELARQYLESGLVTAIGS